MVATAAVIEQALAARWTEGDARDRSVAILCLNHPAPADDRLAQCIASHGGALVSRPGPELLAVFLRIIDAMACAKALQAVLAGGSARIGVNYGEFRYLADGRPGDDVAFALQLTRQAPPGGICISAVNRHAVTSRVDPAAPEAPVSGARQRCWLALQVSGLLAFFLGWCYLIYWKAAYFAEHGVNPCWPDWLCR